MIIYFHKSLDRLGVWLNVELAKTETIQRLFQAMLPKLLLRCQKLFFYPGPGRAYSSCRGGDFIPQNALLRTL
jgi:hypothetical protein